ncbi:Oxidoreductase YdhF [Thalassocella blandensis]|nr:Oxidoreductase YdhF [Thalassocella blandensis]
MSEKSLPIAQHFPITNPITLGCMWFGGTWDGDTIEPSTVAHMHQALDAAMDAGINFIDHADIYALGKAEEVFGRVLQERPELRDKLILQTKCGIRFKDDAGPGRYDFSADWITQSVENSLRRLHTEQLDILLLHRPDPLMQPEEVAEVFSSLHASGKVKHFGISNMHRFQIEFLQAHLSQPLIANQLEVNLNRTDWLDEGVTAGDPQGLTSNFNSGTLEYCRMHNIQIQSWGSLCMGQFSGKPVNDLPAHKQQTAALVAQFAEAYGCSREAILLAWLLKHPANIQPVIGTTNIDRIKACSEAPKVQLSREDWYALYVSSRGQALP